MIQDNGWEDAWWLCCDREIHPEVLNTNQVDVYLVHNETRNIAVLHVSEAGQEHENWLYLTNEPEPAAKTVEPTPTPAHNSELADVNAQMAQAQELIRALADRVSLLERHIMTLNKPLREAMDIIDERARFLSESEEALIARMDEQERTQAELDQLREELASRQAFKVVSSS